jgi:DNA-binding transcriptional regulator YdaS (Cro superfamily)
MKLKKWIDRHPRDERADVRRRLGKKLGVSEVTIRSYANGNRIIPGEQVLPMERETNFEVSRHDSRPDLYPKEAAA